MTDLVNDLIVTGHLTKEFREGQQSRAVLKDINFSVRAGEFLMLLGPSGSGKSTILRILAGLERPTKGTIHYSRQVPQAFIFQNFALFPWLTVFENIEFGLKMQGQAAASRKREVERQIEQMGLKGFAQAYPHELSGGMKQRVGIARALAIQPQIIFLDEPFSALDSFTAKKLRQELLEIWQKQKVTIVMVTHLIEEALQMADRILVLGKQPATIEKDLINPLSRPRDLRSHQFFQLTDQIEQIIA